MRRRYFLAFGKPSRRDSFTLIELLTVIAIIAILAGLVLFAASSVMRTAGRDRARTEIAAMASALESYKTDNGAYPSAPNFGSAASYFGVVPTSSGGLYQQSSQILYQSLTGQMNYGDAPPTVASGVKIYFVFKKSQLGNDTAGGGPIYIKDPFGNSYGYFSGSSVNVPYNGTNSFDLWSTAGDATGTATNTWVNNWGS
jgi:prepilin-type N-terminal cleavage/methylation domain-containing protein